MKIFRLLLILLVASCSWGTLSAQCNFQPHFAISYNTYNQNNIDTLRGYTSGATVGHVVYHWSVDGTSLVDSGAVVYPLIQPGIRVICLTVSDSTGCQSAICDTVTVPNSQCSGFAVSIRDSVSNGGPVYVAHVAGPTPWTSTFQWSDGSTAYLTPPVIQPGTPYCVTATDPGTGCTATACDTVCTFTAVVTDSIVSSNFFHVASVTGIYPYHYWWNSVPGNDYYISSNTASHIQLVMSDANNCFFLDTLHPHPCQLANALTYTYDPFNRYTFQTTTTLGTAPLQYSWTINGYTINVHNATLADSLTQGTYVICSSVTDASSCHAQSCDTVVVAAPFHCGVYVDLRDSLIGSSHYVVSYTHSNISPNSFTYQWSSGAHTTTDSIVQSTHVYCLTVTDNFGCTASSCINTCTLSGAAAATASGNGWNQHVTVSGAVGTVHYQWSSGDSTATFFTTTRGVYHVTVTDSSGCSVVLTDTAGSACYFSGAISVLSNTGNVAVVSANVYNNHGPVSYVWSGGSSFGRIDSLTSSGRYCVTATDTIGCAVTLCDSFVVGCHLTASITDTFVGNGYQLTAHTDSGSAPYHYSWDGQSFPAFTTASLFAVTNQTHCVSITDHNGCTATACDSIFLPCNLTVSIVDSNYGTYHILRAVKTGGAWQSYPIYTWTTPSGPQSGGSPTYIAQLSGAYCVTVRDTNGCTASTCDTVNVGCHLNVATTYSWNSSGVYTFSPTTLSGGSGAYRYTWTLDGQYIGSGYTATYTVPAGIHTACLSVYDTITGCTDSACNTLQSSGPSCHFAASITQSVTGSVAILTAHASGSHGALTYYWPAGSTSAILTAIQSGVYCVSITDSAGCTGTACDTLLLNTCNLHASYSSTHTGSVYIFTGAATGGHGPVTYQWRIDGGTLATGSPYTATLAAGTHQICMYARDTTQCRDSICQTVTVTGSGCAIGGYIKDSVVHSWIGTSHYYVPVIVNGTAPYTYHWSTGSTSPYYYSGFWQPTFNGTVTVTDAAGCSAVLHMNSAYVSTFCGNVFQDLNGNGVQNAGEAGVSGQTIYLYSGSTLVATATTDAYGHYTIPVHPGTYTIQYTAGSSYAITIPFGTSTSPNHAQYGPFTISANGNTYCGYNFGIRNTNVTISGYVYLDANNNGVYDAGETPVANQPVHVGPLVVYTNVQGKYTYIGAAGSYAISYVPSSAYSAYSVTPAGYSVTASVPGAIYTGSNFGLQQTSTACNITTTIVPITTVTAGRPAEYYVYVANHGTNVASGTMTFYYDPALTFDHASPLQASVNTSAHTVSFVTAGLQPGTYASFFLYFNANTNVTIGQSTFEMATATDNCIESNFSDNTDTVHQIATSSWDPNAKTVTPAGEGAQGLIRAGQELRYTINFQNTGTAPAVNVVLQDSIPATLDPSTIKVIGSSHPDYTVQVDGHQLTCRYSQIMLADSFDNEPQSHGFLSFAISPVAGIADGTRIQNTASIFFDYNAAVVTNTTLNTIDYTLSVRDLTGGATITVQPNPFSQYTTIRVTGADMHDATLEVYSALGQLVGSATPSPEGVFTLQRGGLSTGMYSYHIRQSGRTIGSGKLVIE